MDYTNNQVRSYLQTYYSATFRKGLEDHFYNYRNRKTIGLPLPVSKLQFNETEILNMFGENTEHPKYIEIIRFKKFITNPQII